MMILLSMSGMLLTFFIACYFYWQSFQSQKAAKRAQLWFENEDEKKRRSFIYLFGDKFDRSELSESLRERLLQADLSMKASEYVAICLSLFAALWLMNHFILQLLFPLDVVLAYFLVWIGSKFFLNSRKSKRSVEFNRQLPEICRMMSNAVKAGMTLHQGISIVEKELPDPAKREFQEMNQELNLGSNFDEVMNGLTKKIASEELKIFVNTISIQRRVGGNLVEVLSMMAETLEERARVNKEITTITAESKYIALILPLLPVFMAVIMNMVIPGFLNPLFTALGLVLLVVFISLQLVAYFMIKQITRIRV
ncbi:type II secretion system F family protein [Salipaludibacillus sp. HK11]|uniref:type II secretion system F family protein n=1 Tax=Salipaludibacillus sp. HK11 TaxID=3394320 RepID=UPI0039FB967C